MMARFIDTIVQCQRGCRESAEYDRFPDRQKIRELFLVQQEDVLMDYEVNIKSCLILGATSLTYPLQMQRTRIALPDLDYDDNVRVAPRVPSRDPNHKDAAIFRKLLNFSWN